MDRLLATRSCRLASPRWIVLAALVTLTVSTATFAEPPRHLLVVSIDGLAWTKLQREMMRMPTVRALFERGASGPLQTVFPSMTWPAHTSLATGAWPRTHGVVGNRFYDRKADKVIEVSLLDAKAALRVPAIWDWASSAGLSVGALLWPCTGGSKSIAWNLPEVYGQRRFEQASSPAFLVELAEAGLPSDRIGRHGNEELFLLDSFARDAALHTIARHKPNLLLLHFLSVDTTSHAFGPDAPEVRWALDLVDRYLAQVLDAYRAAGIVDPDVVLLSDHGFVALDTRFDPLAWLEGARVFKKRHKPEHVRLVPNGHALYVYVVEDTRDGALRKSVGKAFGHSPLVEQVVEPTAYAQLGLPAPSDDVHMPDLIVLTRPNVMPVVNGKGGQGARHGKHRKDNARPPLRGTHGYLPTLDALKAVFIAAGPHVAQGAVQGMHVTDVAPTLGVLLGLRVPDGVDGKVRREVVRVRAQK